MSSPCCIGESVQVYFPTVDKNNTIELNDRRISQDYYLAPCLVKHRIELDCSEYDQLSNNLLKDSDIWGDTGGATLKPSDSELFAELCSKHGVSSEECLWWMNVPELLSWYKQHAYVSVVLVSRKGSKPSYFFVNTEGHRYARTVGRNYIPLLP
jgi:hypothetical protein